MEAIGAIVYGVVLVFVFFLLVFSIVLSLPSFRMEWNDRKIERETRKWMKEWMRGH